MHIEFSEEQTMLRESAAKYLADNYSFESRQAVVNSGNGFSADQWTQFAEMGWVAMGLPEEHGGFGFGAVENMLLCEELGRHLVLEPYLETAVVAAGLLQASGDEDLMSRYLPGIAEGSLQGALAHAEPGGLPGLANVACTASESDGSFLLSGSKSVVGNGPAADIIIVSAREGGSPDDKVSLFVVEANAGGIQRRDYPTWDGRHASDFEFENTPAIARLGAPGQAGALLDAVGDRAILAACAESVGAMASLLDRTRDYTSQRVQFGQSLSRFQVLRHRMADMFVQIELTRSLLQAAAWQLDAGAPDAARLVSALKVRTVKAARYVSQNAIQLHGGIAMTEELPVGHYFKRLALLEHWFGSRDEHLARVAALRPAA